MDYNIDEKKKKELILSIQGNVYFDTLARRLYSTAACIYQIEPLCVVHPKHKADVIQTVRWAKKYNIPITARGTGSGLAGQTVGEGIIIDFSRYMNRILEISSDYVRLQPGVTLGALNKKLKKYGMFFPPDPASGDYCTLGGMIGNNSSGSHSVKYGATKDYVMELDIILSSGESVKLQSKEKPETQIKEIHGKILNLLKNKREIIDKNTPMVLKNSSGYNLKETLENDGLDLRKLIVGSEGTLAIVTEAKLKIIPLPSFKSTALLFFDNLEKMGEVIKISLKLGPSVIEMMDKGLIELVKKHRNDILFPENTEAALILEFEGTNPDEIRKTMEEAEKKLGKYLIKEMEISHDPKEQEKIWETRKSAHPLISAREDGERRPVTFIEDVAVHPEKFTEYILKLRKILSENDLDVIIYGHAGDGNVHVRPLLNLKNKADIEIMKKMTEEVYKIVFSLGGTLSGEHGDGLLRAHYLKSLYGPLYEIMKEVKEIFDPREIFNPGKIIEKNRNIDDNLRYEGKYREEKFPFKEEELLLSINRCHGCGMCRTFCPMYKVTGNEMATPRTKANWLREIIKGNVTPGESFKSPLAEEIISHCFNCHTCMIECPTGVDGSILARSAKYFMRRHIKISPVDLLLENAEFIARSGAVFSPLSNILSGNNLARLISGIARERNLPEFKKWNIRQNTLPVKSGRVVYFTGCYEKYYEPSQAQAVIDVLNYNGYKVDIPEFTCCEMPKISSGNWDGASHGILCNIKKLFPYAEKGIKIITSCPSCSLALKKDYPFLIKSHMAKVVAEEVTDIQEFILGLYNKNLLNMNFKEQNKSFIYHAPCHLKAQGLGNIPIEVLKLIPGLTYRGNTDSCCGIAGSYGMKEKNFKSSGEIASQTFMEVKNIPHDITVTPCGTCKIQIRQFLRDKVVHPVELLAESYSIV